MITGKRLCPKISTGIMWRNSDKSSSTGWTKPELVLVQSQCPKSFKCFEFRAKAPGGITNQVITPIRTKYKLHEWQHIRKIKVIAKTNSITVPIERDTGKAEKKEELKEGKDYSVEEGDERVRYWICMYCKKKFKTLYECRQHINTAHPK